VPKIGGSPGGAAKGDERLAGGDPGDFSWPYDPRRPSTSQIDTRAHRRRLRSLDELFFKKHLRAIPVVSFRLTSSQDKKIISSRIRRKRWVLFAFRTAVIDKIDCGRKVRIFLVPVPPPVSQSEKLPQPKKSHFPSSARFQLLFKLHPRSSRAGRYAI
jgi:hypothetical protein